MSAPSNDPITITHTRRSRRVCACIPICQPDADRWLYQLLANLDQLHHVLSVAWYGDNINQDTFDRLADFPGTAGVARYQGPEQFDERRRNYPYQIAVNAGAEWMLRMDSDETLVPTEWPMVEYHTAQPPCSYKFRWYNVWQDALPHPLIRLDPPFRPQDNYRVVLHPLKGYGWDWKRPAVASAYCDREIKEVQTDLRLLHWGFSTPELRRFHKDRWDKLYAIGGRPNPYGMWSAACIEGMAWLHPWRPDLSHEEWVASVDAALRTCGRMADFREPWLREKPHAPPG